MENTPMGEAMKVVGQVCKWAVDEEDKGKGMDMDFGINLNFYQEI